MGVVCFFWSIGQIEDAILTHSHTRTLVLSMACDSGMSWTFWVVAGHLQVEGLAKQRGSLHRFYVLFCTKVLSRCTIGPSDKC